MTRPKPHRTRSKPKKTGFRAAVGRKSALSVLGVVLAAGILLLGHVAVARWLLTGPRLRGWINTTPETSLLDYDEAVSTWPGRLRVKNLRIRGSDPNVEWIVVLAEARVDYSVAALLTRTFRADRVRGSGLSFRLRRKLDPSAAKKPDRFLPPIVGFVDPPPRQPLPEAPPEGGHPWTVDIRGLSVDRFEEIWIDDYRFEGSARLRGGFLLRSGQRAHVGPATIDFDGGRFTLASDPVALALSGRLEAAIGEWDPRRVRGAAVMRNVGAAVRLRGDCQGVEFLNHYFRGPEPRFEGGRGTLTIAGSVEQGVGSGLVELTARAAGAHMKGVGLNGHVIAGLRISQWMLDRGSVDLSGSSLALSDVVASGSDTSRRWWGRFTLQRALLKDELRARVEAQCRDGRPLLAVLGVNLPVWTRGLLELDGLTAATNVTLAPARTEVRDLDARGGNFHILGDYENRANHQRGVFLIDTGPLNVGVKIADGFPSVCLIGARDWFEKEKALEAEGRSGPSAGSH